MTPGAECLPRVLVVDDMPDNLFLMNGLLEDRCEVIQATSGAEALKIVHSAAPPDMVLLDIMMPGMDGYEVLRRIRQHAPTANIPVCFLTALGTPDDERLGRELGAVDYLTKPIDPVRIIGRVEQHLRAARRTRRLEELSERLAWQLTPAAWERLFGGEERDSIVFEEVVVTVLYAETTLLPGYGERQRDGFAAEIAWLAARHRGELDPGAYGATVAWFRDPRACVRMAMDLQRSAAELRLRIGVHTGRAAIALYRSEGRAQSTLLGPATLHAARAAVSAASGSITISPSTYGQVRDDLQREIAGCLVTEEFLDEDLAQVCITPPPIAMSSFAGLGLT